MNVGKKRCSFEYLKMWGRLAKGVIHYPKSQGKIYIYEIYIYAIMHIDFAHKILVQLTENVTPSEVTMEGPRVPKLSMTNVTEHYRECDAAKVQMIMDHIQRDGS